MNYEQLCYLRTVIPCRDKEIFEAFDKAANLHAMIKAFEASVHAAWKTFIHEQALKPSSAPAPNQYKKPTFEDFGAAPPLEESHSLQTLESRPHHAEALPPVKVREPIEYHQIAESYAQSAPDPQNLPQPSTGSPKELSGHAASPKAAPPSSPPPVSPAIRFSIRNARQNEPYEGQIQYTPNLPGMRLLDVTLPEGVGLQVDLESWIITGTPAFAGEFNLGLRYAFADQPAHVSHTAPMPFVINADPKTLWKNEPSDRAAPFWKEDCASSVILGQHAKMIAARKRGRSHAHKGTCCDDDFHLHCDDANGWYLAVVADGAGSAKFSRRGSQVATRAVGSYLKDVFSDERGSKLVEAIEALAEGTRPDATNDDLIRLQQKTRNELFTTIGYAAHHAVRELQNEAKSRSDVISSPKELSTTLLIGLARKVGEKWFCAAYWVGDGAVAVYRRNRSVHLLGSPDSGEFSGQTHFLDASQVSQESLLRRLRFELVEDMTAFLLMTDGVSDPKFRSESAMAELQDWDGLWDDLETGAHLSSSEEGHETRLLEWLDFWAQGEYDDRTIAIIY